MAGRTEPPRLHCPKCASAYGVATVFDHCTVAWPNQGWLWFDCPGCGKGFHVELEPGRVSIGGIDGAPGPAFFPDETVEVDGLTYEKRFGGLEVTLGARRWQVEGKR